MNEKPHGNDCSAPWDGRVLVAGQPGELVIQKQSEETAKSSGQVKGRKPGISHIAAMDRQHP